MRLTIPVVVTVVSAACGGAASVPRDHPEPTGPPLRSVLGLSGLPGGTDDARAFHARATREAGLTWVRGDLTWSRIEPERGEWRWDSTDAAIEAALRNGKQVIGLLVYGNQWAVADSPSPAGPAKFPPDDPETFATFVREAVSRYSGRVRVWEIWNEPNTARFWLGTPRGDPAGYGALLRAAARAVRLADSEATVLFGGLFYHGQGITHAAPDFLDASLRAHPGLAEHFDGLAFHPYDLYPPSAPPESNEAPHVALETMVGRLREVLGRHDAAETPIWITELGWPDYGRVSEELQAAYASRAMLLAVAQGVRAACWYTLWDGKESEGFPPEGAFGLFRWQAEPAESHPPSPKPAFDALVQLTDRLGDLGFVTDRTGAPGVPAGRRALVFSDGSTQTRTATWDPDTDERPDFLEGDVYRP